MKAGWREMDKNANEAMKQFHDRTNWQPVELRMAFDEMIEREDDGTGEPVQDYEVGQRKVGARAFVRFVADAGLHPAAMLKQFLVACRAMGIAPFANMTMGEIGLLFSETKAAHSHRCKLLSGEMEHSGIKAARMAGQKTKAATDSYKQCRKGNNNRKGGKKVARRQESFLRKLHLKTPTS